jgi:hypothetical protein
VGCPIYLALVKPTSVKTTLLVTPG